ncbi:hypothetical protein J1N35_007784 [Gossypium stocksii]|uniref:Aminotransferase-like plant mobile domain-containing protein n=1 Tax=Gossypium stocksii TaxID=47602 RepID=A0A9D4AFZ8_9ROSI|nr:hypothetical protein J1N35_007784 [Gossypium stocksii]
MSDFCVAIIGRGCKLDPTLVSTLVERWRPKTYTFHLSCDMNWLRRNFSGFDEDSTKVQREQHARAYIFMIIGGFLIPDKSQLGVSRVDDVVPGIVSGDRTRKKQNWWLHASTKIIGAIPAAIFSSLSRLHYTFTLVTRWNHGLSYIGLPDELQDMWLLLDQRSETEFEWMPYSDSTIQECILSKLLVNPNIWHVKVLLVVVHDKLYLLREESKGKPPHKKRLLQMPRNLRQGGHDGADKAGFAYRPLSPKYYTSMPLKFLMTTMPMTTYRSPRFGAPIEILITMPPVYETQYSYIVMIMVSQTPSESLFYQGGLSS